MEKERKLQIIKAAIKRFSKHGIKKTTLDEVARDLRIGKATIYHYFKSKEDLYFESLSLEFWQFIEELKILFANAELHITEKLSTYFLLKESIPEKYKLIQASVVEEINETLLENEKQLLLKIIAEETAIIKDALTASDSMKPDISKSEFTNFLIDHSWAVVFSHQFTGTIRQINPSIQNDLLSKMINKYLS